MKHFKRILVLVCTLCVALGLGLMAACGPDNPEPAPSSDVTYTVTVTCDNALILSGVKVKMTPEDGAETEAALVDGKATFTLPAGTYTASLVETMEGILTGYTYAPQTLTATSPSATIALTAGSPEGPGDQKEMVDYTLTVQLPDGTPVANLMVQLCGGPVYTCHVAETDANGVASYKLEAGNYEVHIAKEQENYPAEYIFDDTRYTMGSAGGELTVSFETAQEYTVTVVYAGNLLTGAEERPAAGLTVALFEETNDEDNGKQYAAEAFCSAKTDEQGVATLYAFGGDHVYVARITDCPIEYGYQNTITVEATAPAIKLELNELGTSLYNTITVGVGTYTVNITADRKEYYYDFDPASKAGYYRISSSGTYKDPYDNNQEKDVDAYVARYSGTFAFVNSTPEEECEDISDSNVHFSMEFCIMPKEITTDGMGNRWIFKVGANATLFGSDTRPFKITFEYVREYVAPTDKTETPNAEQTISDLSGYTQPAETTWTWLQPGVKLEKDSAGVYHLNSATGPVVYAAVAGSKYIPQGMDANFAAAIAQGNTAFQYSTGIADEHNVITTYLLTTFFTDYASAANADGLHPLTEELKLALQAYCVHNGIYAADGLGWDKENDQLFLFACGYFKSDYATPLFGQGTEDEPYVLNGEDAYGTYKFTMPEGGKLYFATRLGGIITFACDATLTIGEDTYNKDQTASFEANSSHTNFNFALAAGSELQFTFAPELGGEQNPIVWQMGSNTANIPESKISDGVWYRFTPTASGLYTITTSDPRAAIESPEGYFDRLEGEGSVTLELLENHTYLFLCSVAEGQSAGSYNVVFTKAAAESTASGTGASDSPFGIITDGWYHVVTNDQGGEYGQYFAFNARTEGHWQIKCYNPDAVVLYFAPGDQEGVSASLGDDEPFFTVNIQATMLTTGVYTFFMGTTDFVVREYYFYFGEAPQESEPGPGGEGGGSGESGNWEGSGTDFDPYILEKLEGDYSVYVPVGEMWAEHVCFTFTSTESATYTLTLTSDNEFFFWVYYYNDAFINQNLVNWDEGNDGQTTTTFTVPANTEIYMEIGDWTDAGNCTLTFTITKDGSSQSSQGGQGGGSAQQGDLVVGANVIDLPSGYDTKTFVAPEDGTYTFSVTSKNAAVMLEQGENVSETILDGSNNNMKTYSMKLTKGQSITLSFATNDWGADTFTLTIAKA